MSKSASSPRLSLTHLSHKNVFMLQNLLELVANEMAGENCQADAGLVAFYNTTLAHIAAQKVKPEKASLYEALQI